MAIDTRNKRASAGSLLWVSALPDPDDSVDDPDRLQVAGCYCGIAAAAPGGLLLRIILESLFVGP